MERTCSKCHTELVTVEAVGSTGGKLLLAPAPFKNFVSAKKSSPLLAYACPACGLVEWYAEKPKNLTGDPS